MDEKTEELRDIFVDATGSDTVTERQEETPGTLTADRDAPGRVADVIETMRERYDFRTDLDADALRTVVEAVHDGDTDADIAETLDVDEATVFEARMDLHLVRDSDREAPFDLGELRSMLVEDADIDEAAEALGAEVSDVEHYRDVIEADLEATRANDRFRDEFAELLTDADLASTHARDAREDGLRDATEDIESNVSF